MESPSVQGSSRGDTACPDPWRPYVAVGPARQSSACPTARHGDPGRMDSAIPSRFALSRVRRLLRVAAAASASSRAHALASQRLRTSDSAQRSASFSVTPSSSWLRLPRLGKPALSSPSRAYLAGAPPWSPASWPGLCSPPFLFILLPKAPLGRADARSSSLSPCLRPETPTVGRAPPPCRHSRGRGT